MPAPGEALIRVTRVAICREDLDAAKAAVVPASRADASPVTLGSQFVGLVEKVSPVLSGTTSGWEPRRIVGKLVAVNPDIACGKCDLCQRGLASHCRARISLGLQRDGGLADLVCVPISNLHVVPEHVDDDRAVFAASVAAAAHTAMQLRVEGRPYITVLGDGPVGLLTAQVLARLNASVRVLGRHEAKLELCAKWGVKHRLVSESGLRADQDIVIDCTGTREGLEAALKMVRPRGKVLVKAVPTGAVDIAPVVAGEIELLGSRGGSIPEALSLIAREQVDVVSLISRRFKLGRGDRSDARRGLGGDAAGVGRAMRGRHEAWGMSMGHEARGKYGRITLHFATSPSPLLSSSPWRPPPAASSRALCSIRLRAAWLLCRCSRRCRGTSWSWLHHRRATARHLFTARAAPVASR